MCAFIIKHFIWQTQNNVIDFSKNKTVLTESSSINSFIKLTRVFLVVVSDAPANTKTDEWQHCSDC
jgi:hypothetical protein